MFELLTSWESSHRIGSFQICSEEIGESSLHVSLTTYYGDRNEVPITLESYKDVCSCQNIPEFVQNWDKWSIDNHGNDIVAYFEQDCGKEKFEPVNISAGHSKMSREIYKNIKTENVDQTTESTYKTQLINRQGNEKPNDKVSKIVSFGPDLNSSYFKTSCVKFNGTVVKFEIDDKGKFDEFDLHIDMFNNVFRNNEHYSMSRTYFVSKIVEETFHVQMDSNRMSMRSILVDEDFEVESNFDQNVFREQAIREVLRKAYAKTEENSENNRNATLNSFKTFSVKQVLSIPPCTEHKLNAYVNMLNNDRVEFRALMKIGGFIGERKMVAGEVKRFLDSRLEFKGEYDGYTVMAYGKGVVGMTFGTRLVVEGEDFAILECVSLDKIYISILKFRMTYSVNK